MTFAHPLILLLLLPWAGVVVYLLRGARTVQPVPFLFLWRRSPSPARVERSMQTPPRWVIALLAAILAAVFAGATPQVGTSHPRINILVDNGATLEPPGRLKTLLGDAANRLNAVFGNCDLTLYTAIGDEQRRLPSSSLASLDLPTYPVETEAILNAKIARLLLESDTPVLLLSDRRLQNPHPRVYQLAPRTNVQNVGIVTVVVREYSLAQAMVRVRNDSPLADAAIEVITGPITVQQKISLPPPGEERDYFLDLAEVGPQVEVTLKVSDEFDTDNHATLIRAGSNPRLEIRGDVDPSVRRIVEVYSNHRPPDGTSQRVIVCDSLFQLGNERSIAVASSRASLSPLRGALQVEMGHPLLREIDFRSIDRSTSAGASPGDGWTNVVRANDLVLLAVREKPARQVWVGFHSPSFESTRDFVILFANIFDYLGDGGDRFAGEPVSPLAPNELPPKQPGVYQRGDGTRVAMNLSAVQFQRDPSSLTRLPTRTAASGRAGGFLLSPWLTLLALLLVGFSAWSLRSSA